jgi:hypothetical protein
LDSRGVLSVARRRRVIVGACLTGVLGAAGIWVALETYLPPLYHSTGWFRRVEYEAIVERVATLSIPETPPARPTELLMTDRSNLASIVPFSGPERERYYTYYPNHQMIIYAMRTETDLRVTLITHDAGHAGLYGFAYTRAGWSNGDGIPGHVWLDGTIDEHWARVMNNLQ